MEMKNCKEFEEGTGTYIACELQNEKTEGIIAIAISASIFSLAFTAVAIWFTVDRICSYLERKRLK